VREKKTQKKGKKKEASPAVEKKKSPKAIGLVPEGKRGKKKNRQGGKGGLFRNPFGEKKRLFSESHSKKKKRMGGRSPPAILVQRGKKHALVSQKRVGLSAKGGRKGAKKEKGQRRLVDNTANLGGEKNFFSLHGKKKGKTSKPSFALAMRRKGGGNWKEETIGGGKKGGATVDYSICTSRRGGETWSGMGNDGRSMKKKEFSHQLFRGGITRNPATGRGV